MYYDDDREAGLIVAAYYDDYLSWLKAQFNLRQHVMTATFSIAMIVITVSWYAMSNRPLHFLGAIDFLETNFIIDDSDASTGHAYRYCLYWMHWSDEWLNGLLMFACFVLFGGGAEERLGQKGVLLLYLSAALAGAWLHMLLNGTHAEENQTIVKTWINMRLSGVVRDASLYFADLIYWIGGGQGSRIHGAAALIWASMVVTLGLRPGASHWRNERRWVPISVLMLAIEMTGVLRFHESFVAYSLRMAGVVVGVLFVMGTHLLRAVNRMSRMRQITASRRE